MACLGSIVYDPVTSVTKATSAALAMTAVDTTNCRLTFTAPASLKVLVRIRCIVHGATTMPSILLGVLEGATVVMRVAPIGGLVNTAVATALVPLEATAVLAVTAGSHTFDAAYGVETLVAATGIKYGGANDATANNAFGAFIFEVWEA
jgi:hypothetical protein